MRYIIILICSVYLGIAFSSPEEKEVNSYDPDKLNVITLGPPNYQLYEYMKQYSEQYNIPFNYALRCAREETGYRGKLDFTYKPFEDKLRRSFADAYGPLQVQVPTANDMWDDREISADDLGYNIQINVETSFRYKRYLHDRFKDWYKVYSIYNMGWKGKIYTNQYAKNIVDGNTQI